MPEGKKINRYLVVGFLLLAVLSVGLGVYPSGNKVRCVNCRSNSEIHVVGISQEFEEIAHLGNLLTIPLCNRCLSDPGRFDYSSILQHFIHMDEVKPKEAVAILFMLSKIGTEEQKKYVLIDPDRQASISSSM